MPRHRRSQDELQQELHEQAAALRASAAGYDSGHLWEAKRLATTAYVLLHDGGRNCRSLLGQLGLKGPMMSTANDDPGALLPLAVIEVDVKAGGAGMTFKPFLEMHSTKRRTLPFSRWYEEPVFENGRLNLTRKNLICTFRSQVGGSHADAVITDESFQWLRTNSPIHVKTAPAGAARDADGNEIECPSELEGIFADFDGAVPNGHFASMRQIAWEIDQKLQELGY